MNSTLEQNRVTAEDFKFAFRHHPAGVAVISADAGNGPVAMTVSSMASVAIDPPTLVFSASQISSATPTIREAETIVVHLIASDQVELARLCATSGAERFGEEVNWGRLSTGEPYYPDATEWLRGRVSRIVDVNGSTLVIVEALEAKPREGRSEEECLPLVYHNRTWHTIGEQTRLP